MISTQDTIHDKSRGNVLKRWGAALACGLVLATTFSGVAQAEPSDLSPSDPAPAASCAPLRAGQFGALAADQIGAATVAPGQTGCHEVTLATGPHYIQTPADRSFPPSFLVRDAAGNQVCAAVECDIPATGAYTIEVPNPTDQTLSYRVAAIPQDPVHCTTRARTAWNSAATPVPSTGIEALCVRFTGTEAEKINVYNAAGSSNIRELDGSLVCHLPTQLLEPCRLPGSGTFLAMTAAPPSATSNEIQVRSITRPVGCPVHTPKPFGSSNRFSDVRCRVLDAPAAGTYLVRSRTPQNTGQATGVFDPSGKPVCTSAPLPVLQQEVCALPAAGRYLVIAETLNTRLVTKSFTTTFAAMNGPGCRLTTTQGVAGPNARGAFRAIGQVDCWQFETPWRSETGVVLPPNASGAGVPLMRYYDSANNAVCSTAECDLPGPATYRLLLTAPAEAPTGDYIFALQDRHSLWNCKPWDPSVRAQFRSGRFTECFEFVPDRDSSDFTVAVERLTGSGAVHATVRPTAGAPCDGFGQAEFSCEVTAGNVIRLVLAADPVTAKYRITRSYGSAPEPPATARTS
ncbi:hypothetical protein Abr02nite_01840 [Paractinoplanes brasiliensis]|nr:hypothetical protein Abr02nite_01840 [Actinoplanes brasiliensis]